MVTCLRNASTTVQASCIARAVMLTSSASTSESGWSSGSRSILLQAYATAGYQDAFALMATQADQYFLRAAEASPRNPYVYLSWGQMRFQHCRSAGGAREIFARGAEVCPKCAPNQALHGTV